MYEFEEEGIINYLGQEKDQGDKYYKSIQKKSIPLNSDRQVIEPWSDHSFQLRPVRIKESKEKVNSKTDSRNSYKKSRVSEPKAILSSRQSTDGYNPIYRMDTEEQNMQQKFKWRMEYQFMRARRKKETELIRIKHYGHMRSHTINASHLLMDESQEDSKKTLDISEISKQLHKYSRKQEISNRLKTTIKFNTGKNNKQNSNLKHSGSDQAEYCRFSHRQNDDNNKKKNMKETSRGKKFAEPSNGENEFNIFSLSKINNFNEINISPQIKQKLAKPRNNWQIRKNFKNQQFKINLPKRDKKSFCPNISSTSIYRLNEKA